MCAETINAVNKHRQMTGKGVQTMAKAVKNDGRQIIRIFDTTLRDGEQAPGNSMNIEEKLRIARQLQVVRARQGR